MIAKSITYTDFRNIENESLELCEGVNVLWGNNAEGKSNMLEGVYFFARGKSFRGSKEKELVSFGKTDAHLSLSFLTEKNTYPTSLSAVIPTEGKKQIYRNGAKLVSVREMIGSFRAVLFCPAHLSLVEGMPALRRQFLDVALSQLYPAYIDDLSRYKAALAQRNALLKDVQMFGKNVPDIGMFEVYAMQLASYGASIARRRMEYMEKLSVHISELFDSMTNGREKPSFVYKSVLLSDGEADKDAVSEEKLYSVLTEDLEKDIRYGTTTHGIHKDDISVKLNGKEARLYASQGQQRSLALSMKLAEGELSQEISGDSPVFLLDDVMSELDTGRRSFILSKLPDKQIIITSCEPDGFRSCRADRLFHIENGKIIETEF